jgi:hypothetical protein
MDALFFMLRKPDELSQNTVALAMLQNYTIQDGRFISIVDYVNESRPDNYYQLSKEDRKSIDKKLSEQKKDIKSVFDMAELKDGIVTIPKLDEIGTYAVNELRNTIKQVNKNIIGNVDSEDISTYKRVAWARSLMLFRNWMPRAIDERFGELRYNRELNKNELGRYRTMLLMVFKGSRDSANNLKWNMLLGVEKVALIEYKKYLIANRGQSNLMTENEFVDLYKSNIAAQMRELQILAGFLAMMFAGYKYIDDDRDKRGAKYAYKLAKRAYSELAMFWNPVEALNILKNPSAAIAPLTDMVRLLKHSTYELTGQIIGDDKMVKEAQPLRFLIGFTGLGSIERTISDLNKDWEEFTR